MKKKAIVTTTPGIMTLAWNASGRNRSIYEKEFEQNVDPEGIHVLGYQLDHNDTEIRTQWFCKMKGTLQPAEIWLDVDGHALNGVAIFGVSVEAFND